MKKLLAITIILLFFGMIIFPSSGIKIEQSSRTLLHRGNTLYVGGNGSGNYSKIQDAIDNASDGDTVFVYDDSSPYNEWDIQINKSINLIGEDKNTTIFNGYGYDVIEVTADWVTISGFTIDTTGWGVQAITGNDTIISDNHFISCSYGIRIWSNETYIISNSFREFDLCAIRIESFSGASDITISNNIINSTTDEYNPYMGDIYIYNYKYGGSNLSITNNSLIRNNPNEYRKGLYLRGVSDSIIKGNKFIGYYLAFQLIDDDNTNNIISYNNFTDNSCGIKLGGYGFSGHSYSNKVINNNFINNEFDASINPKCLFNLWDGNYWDDWIGLKYKLPIFQRFPKIIRGGLLTFAIDWNPAKQPYDI